MKKRLVLLLIFIGVLYLLPIFFRPLMAPDEFRYAEIPREMLETGDFITPRLLSGRYFEKPVLGYWLTAASFSIFGLNAFALRLVPVLSALLTAGLLGWWCLKRSPRETAFNAVLLYLACGMVWVLGTFATLDSLFVLWTTATLVFFGVAMESTSFRERQICLAAAGAALGLGFLTKGLLAYALPGISVAAYLIWQKRWKDIFTMPWLPLLVSFAVIAPWAVAIHRVEPDYWNHFIIHEHFRRFADSATGQHEAPFWLLFPFLFAGVFPAFFPVLAGARHTGKEAWKELWRLPEMRFSLCAVVLPLFLLSCSDGKLPTYVLPCFAPAVMAGTLILGKADPQRTPAALRKLTTSFAVIAIILGSLFLLTALFYLLWGTGFVPILPLELAVWTPLITIFALGTVTAGTLLFVNRRLKLPEPESGFMLFVIPVLMSVWFFPGFTANFKMPEYELLELIGRLAQKGAVRPRVFTVSRLMHSVAWCCRDRKIQLLSSQGEMRYGHKAAVKNGERPIVFRLAELSVLLKDPRRTEDVVLILLQKYRRMFEPHLPRAAENLSTSGDICALYFPGKKGGPVRK